MSELDPDRFTLRQVDQAPLTPRINTLRGIFAKLRPERVHEPLPPPRVYVQPPNAAQWQRG